MSKYIFIIIMIILTFVFFIGCNSNPNDIYQSRIINVSGSAEIKVIPDKVVISLEVETWNEVLTQAKQENDDIVKHVLGLSEKYDVDTKYFQTDRISIYPTYKDRYNNDGKIIISGYSVKKGILITLNDLSKYEGVITDAVNAGVNHINDIQFLTTELRKHKDDARKMAINAAKEKATDLLGEIDAKLGDAISVNESANYYNYWSYGQRYNTQNVYQNTTGDMGYVSETAESPGQISITANVSVSFKIE